MSGPPEGAIAALLYHETTEFSNTGVFQHKMSLRRQGSGQDALRVNASHDATCQRLTLEEMEEFASSSSSLGLSGADHKEIHGLVEGASRARLPFQPTEGLLQRLLDLLACRSGLLVTVHPETPVPP